MLSAVLGVACIGKQPCTQSGDGFLVVPESRVDAIAEIQVDGDCEVFAPVADCDAGGCIEWRDAGPSRPYRVTARERGECMRVRIVARRKS